MNEIQEGIEKAQEVLMKEKPCKACVFSNSDCTWCLENKIPITPYTRGCHKFLTDQMAARKIAEEEFEKCQKNSMRQMLNMDVMAYLIAGASIVLEKIDKEMEDSYESIINKDDDTIRNHQERKKNRNYLRKAFLAMKFNAQDMRNNYDKYVEHYFNVIFSNEDNTYNFKESDKNLSNAGVVTSFVKLLVDCILENADNANAIMEFMKSLPRAGILDERDFGQTIIRR